MAEEDKFILDGGEALLMPEHKSYTRHIFDKLKLGGQQTAQLCLDTGETITFEELLQKGVNMAVALQNLNVRKGDIVAICSENNFDFSITILGSLFSGASITPINPAYTEGELKHTLNLSKPNYIACSPTTVQRVASLLPQMPFVRSLIVYGDEHKSAGIPFDTLVSNHRDVQTFQLVPSCDQDVMLYLYSSGTTGLPKCVMLTQYNSLFQHLNYSDRVIVSKSGTVLPIGPWFHIFGLQTMMHNLATHHTTAFFVKFDQDKFLEGVEKYKINIVLLVPPLILFLAKSPKVDQYDLSSIEMVWCSTAALSREIVQKFKERIGVSYVGQGYGMTETYGTFVDDSKGKKLGSLGRLLRGIQAKIVDLNTGKPLGPHQNGELCVKGAGLMKGYLNNKEATEAMMDKDGFLHTGDIAYYDDDKFFYFIDRLKEIIKFKGFQVSPSEIEGVLLQHPGVLICGVVPIPDDYAGELPLAFVVRQPNSTVTEKELIDLVASKLSATKHLRGGVRFLEDIPTQASGKVLRRKLKELV